MVEPCRRGLEYRSSCVLGTRVTREQKPSARGRAMHGLHGLAGGKHSDGSWARRWAAEPGLMACHWAAFGLEIGLAKKKARK